MSCAPHGVWYKFNFEGILRQLVQGLVVLLQDLGDASFPALHAGGDGQGLGGKHGAQAGADAVDVRHVGVVEGDGLEHGAQNIAGLRILHEAEGQSGLVVSGADDLVGVASSL